MAIVPVSHKTVLISVLLFPVPVVSVAADTGNGLIGKTVAVVKETKRLENIQNLAETAGDDTWGEVQ